MNAPESRWRTPFDVRIIGRSMSEIENLARLHRRSLPSGYRVRVDGVRLTAEVRGKSLDPRLVAEMVPLGTDTRIVGELSWLATPVLAATAAGLAAASGAATILLGVGGHGVAASVAGFLSVCWGLSAGAVFRRNDEAREAAEQQLRDELRMIFYPEARREGLTSLDQLLQERPPGQAP